MWVRGPARRLDELPQEVGWLFRRLGLFLPQHQVRGRRQGSMPADAWLQLELRCCPALGPQCAAPIGSGNSHRQGKRQLPARHLRGRQGSAFRTAGQSARGSSDRPISVRGGSGHRSAASRYLSHGFGMHAVPDRSPPPHDHPASLEAGKPPPTRGGEASRISDAPVCEPAAGHEVFVRRHLHVSVL